MGTKDARIDAYIEKKSEFARPIVKKLRALVHKGCPAATETLKWSHPSFEYKGMYCGIAIFKEHGTFGFWKDKLLRTSDDNTRALDALGCIKSTADLPSDAVILKLIKQAAKLNDDGVKVSMRSDKPRKALPMPKDFATAIKKNKSAAANFEAFSPSKKRDYIEWITDAKSDDTRQRRMDTAVEWIAEGKARNWKYEKN